MTIDSVSVSCDCVSAQLAGNTVAPGESTTLLVEVNPKEPGEFQQEIVVHIAGEKPGFIRVRAER
jgi:hypothetical protein